MLRRLSMMLVVFLFAIFVSPVAAQGAVIDPPVMVVAHATGQSDAPLNSVQGVTIAANNGAKWIEMDIRFNKSNFPIGLHDATVDSVTPATGLLRDLWLPDTTSLNSAAFAPWNNATTYPQFNGTGSDGLPKVHLNHLYWYLYAADAADVGLILDMKDNPNAADAARLHDYFTRPEFDDVPIIFMANNLSQVDYYKSLYPAETIEYWLIETPATGFIRAPHELKNRGITTIIYPWWFTFPDTIKSYHINGIKYGQYNTNSADQDVLANWKRITDNDGDVIISNEYDLVQDYIDTL